MINFQNINLWEKFPALKTYLLIMKLTFIISFLSVIQISASVYSQNRLSFAFENKRIKEVLEEIEKTTELRFFYNEDFLDMDRHITLKGNDVNINDFLASLLEESNAGFKILDKNLIVIVPEEEIQPGLISGIVTDEKGNPLPGVSVQVKGYTIGTTTGSDGKYTLSIPVSAQTLVFSFIGMQTQEVPVGAGTVYNIILSESLIGLEEVIVIGYGTAKKSDLTGSVSRVEGEDIKLQAPTQIVETLSGTVAGLYTTQATSAKGGGEMELRGPTSISAGTNPMIVLDGAIYFGSISDINPADIESVDILKDASSAAIYGSKAASGIIQITTTKGRVGKPTINFSAKVGVSSTTNDLKPYGPQEYLNMHRDYQTQSNKSVPYGYFFQPDNLPQGVTIEAWRNMSANPAADNTDEWISRINLWPIEIKNFKAGETTDFYDLCIGPALKQDYTLSAGGGTEDLQYYWSVGYLDNKGVIKGDEFTTVRSKLNVDLKISNWLNIGTNTQFAYRDESVVQANILRMSRMSPYGSMRNDDGTLRKLPGDYSYNPLENYYGQNRFCKTSSLFSNLFAQIKLPFGFHYKISFQPNFSFTKDFNFWSSKTEIGSEWYVGGYGDRFEYSSLGWMVDNLLAWEKTFGDHNFNLTFLANAEQQKSWSTSQGNSNFAPNENLGFHALQFGDNPWLSNYDDQSSGEALMARLNYTLKNRYLLTTSIRRDGYSAFGQQNPRASFPAFAFAWKIDQESFYNLSWMNRLKLRLSWGINGNRDIGIYSALARVGSVMDYNLQGMKIGVYNSTMANSNLRWEKTTSTNIGFDIGLLQDRIDMTIDAYSSSTTDLLLDRQLPQTTGFSNITSNLGILGNKGIEVSINTVNIKSTDLDWKSNLVFSMNRNKIIKLWEDIGDYKLLGKDHYGELPDFTNKWFPGEALDVVWDYDFIGIWQLDQAAKASEYGLAPGDPKATDVDQDGKYLQLQDKKFIGHTTPLYRIGIKNEITFLKNFSASLFIRADLGHIRSIPFLTEDKSAVGRHNTWSFPYWSPENPINDFPRYVHPNNLSHFEGGIVIYKPAGFVRVQDFMLSYNLPHTYAQRIKLKSLRVFLTTRNLFTFTKWPGYDPESAMIPMPKVFTFGLDLSL
jgi:TonB-linked SusC/RagA family outer membrane protein